MRESRDSFGVRFARFESRIGDTNRKFCKRRSQSRIANQKKYLPKNESWFALWFADSSDLFHKVKSPNWTKEKLLKQYTVQIGDSLARKICRTPQLVYLIKDYKMIIKNINKLENKKTYNKKTKQTKNKIKPLFPPTSICTNHLTPNLCVISYYWNTCL